MTGLTAKIALEGATFAFDKLYTYLIPCDLNKFVLPGCRVTVPFGRGNIKKQGIVLHVDEGELKGLKPISSLIDKSPVLTPEMTDMCEYLHENVFCTYYDAVKSMLPAGMNYRLVNFYSVNNEFSSDSVLSSGEREIYLFLKENGEKSENIILKKFNTSKLVLDSLVGKQAILINKDPKRRLNDSTQSWLRLCEEDQDGVKLTQRQREIIDFVRTAGCVSIKELRYFTGVSVSVINNLVNHNVLECYEKQVFRMPFRKPEQTQQNEIKLTEEQNEAFKGLLSEYKKDSPAVSLLYGITGSGKTQVYLKLVDIVSECGRGVIVMVPEIALTPQLLQIFTERYGDKVAVFHSALSMGQRMDEWQRIKSGKATIAIGTRSAVFAPLSDVGLIIIDEEHEHTYKSETTPRFHARELAKFRTAYHGGLLLLASATPSLETYTSAKSGKFSYFSLTKRYGNAVLPDVCTVDMKKEILSGNSSSISRLLYDSMCETLQNKKQVILLLNRRGHNTYISCPDCGYVVTCPNCSISLTYHSANDRLMCHYCGYSVKSDKKCPECGKEHMKYLGIGTQKVEEEIKSLFPKHTVLRVDADSMTARESYSEYLNDFADGKYDILLGTQMVAKGLNFPNVTLVGVLGADSAMYSEDFRSYERTFSLLTQVVGRAGRGDTAGKAIIQTVNPDSNVIELAAKQDYDSFYNEEILTRKLMIYPPYCDICAIYAKSENSLDTQNTINGIFVKIKEMLNDEFKDVRIIILGPSPTSVPRVNNKYRWRMIIKCHNNRRFRDMLRKALETKHSSNTTVMVDINPETVL